MRLANIFFVGLLGVALAACSPTIFNSGGISAGPDTSVLNQEETTDAICMWGKAAGLPYTKGRAARQDLMSTAVLTPAQRNKFIAFYKETVSTSVAYECECGDEARRAVLQCDKLEASG